MSLTKKLHDGAIYTKKITIIIAGEKLVYLQYLGTTVTIPEIFDMMAVEKQIRINGSDNMEKIPWKTADLFAELSKYGIDERMLAGQYVDEIEITHMMYEMTGGDRSWNGGIAEDVIEWADDGVHLSRFIQKEMTAWIRRNEMTHRYQMFFDEYGERIAKSAAALSDVEVPLERAWSGHRNDLAGFKKEFYEKKYTELYEGFSTYMRSQEASRCKI